jgi:uncharacterized protein YndB with AHSA1/START domain
MTIAIEVCIEIPVAPDSVWRAIENIETHTVWMADAEAITFVGDQRQGVGTEFECLTVVGPLRTSDRMRITEWAPPAVMGIEHHGAVSGTGRFTLTSTPRGTEFCWNEQLTFSWWLGGLVGERVGKPVLTRIWRRNLARLRAHVLRVVTSP